MRPVLLSLMEGTAARRCGCGAVVPCTVTRWGLRMGRRNVVGRTYQPHLHTAPTGTPCPAGAPDLRGTREKR